MSDLHSPVSLTAGDPSQKALPICETLELHRLVGSMSLHVVADADPDGLMIRVRTTDGSFRRLTPDEFAVLRDHLATLHDIVVRSGYLPQAEASSLAA